MKTVFFIIADAGGGHRAVADALKKHLLDHGSKWDIRILNVYKDILNERAEDLYNAIVKLGLSRFYWPVVVPLFRLRIKWTGNKGGENIHKLHRPP